MSQKHTITVTVTIKVDHDIQDHHRVNIVTNSLAWVACRIGKGHDSGNLHGAGGPPYGHFSMTCVPQNSPLHEGAD